MACPNLPHPTYSSSTRGCVFYCERGSGAFTEAIDGVHEPDEVLFDAAARPEARRIRVSDEADPASIVMCESFDAAHSSHDTSHAISERLGIAKEPIRIDSMCKYGLLSRGDAHVYMRFPRAGYQENVWDHMPGALLLEEAGGVVTDAHGKRLDFSLGAKLERNVGIIAASAALHARVLREVKAVVGSGDAC